jgi:hypothetical protein
MLATKVVNDDGKITDVLYQLVLWDKEGHSVL